MDSYAGSGDLYTFTCHKCSRAYKHKSSLSLHLRFECGQEGIGRSAVVVEATGETRYVCVACGRRYKQKRNLSQHQRLECAKEPQFACSSCPYKAKQKSTLKTHMALIHKIQM
ncbi:zinc finger protein 569-like [Homalodisca vitripennis]|uniref:zinc finger protein 569-like n=1 Tax=Homalodisca vitripennis TaxID=197043 RepID=UPI001EECCE90|nr:zinc finger protein 569-like [Homalodisca vitripennis]KAG8259308.1 hypothetical protein J6590_014777 [Homalodisca vitripennis]